ncbi:class F sortase, partial [Streptomyces cinereoruber]|uniref:class F sortase n=1 Tax=Streptomyces cinereoruber TaxID=67260 RepID=UPI003637CF45
ARPVHRAGHTRSTPVTERPTVTSPQRTGHRRILGVAALLVAAFLCGALAFVALRGQPTRAADFGTVPTTKVSSSDPTRAAPAQDSPPSWSTTAPADSVPSGPADPSPPKELSVPRLGLRAPVDPVGVADDGLTEVPPDPDRVGWYRFSPAPGSPEGSSVVVGHVDAEGRGLGVLNGLNEVRQGDRVVIGRRDGSVVAYRVVARRTVGKEDLAESGAFRRDGRPVLTLITCAGPYLPDNGGYQNNLVVTAVEASE